MNLARGSRHRGAILVVALGILAILAVIGATMINVARVDHLSARTYKRSADLDQAVQSAIAWVDWKGSVVYWRTNETEPTGAYDEPNSTDSPLCLVRPDASGNITGVTSPDRPGLYLVKCDNTAVPPTFVTAYFDSVYIAQVNSGKRRFNIPIMSPLPPPGTAPSTPSTDGKIRGSVPDGGIITDKTTSNDYRLRLPTDDNRSIEVSLTTVDLGGRYNLNFHGKATPAGSTGTGQSYDDDGVYVIEVTPYWASSADPNLPIAAGSRTWDQFVLYSRRWGSDQPSAKPVWPDWQMNPFDPSDPDPAKLRSTSMPAGNLYKDLPFGLEDLYELLNINGTRFVSRFEAALPETFNRVGRLADGSPEPRDKKIYFRSLYTTHSWASAARKRIPQNFTKPSGFTARNEIDPPDLPAVKADLNSGPEDDPASINTLLDSPLRRAMLATRIWSSYPNREVDQILANLMDSRDKDCRPRAVEGTDAQGDYTVFGVDCHPYINEVFIDQAHSSEEGASGDMVDIYPVYVELANPYDKVLNLNDAYVGRLDYGPKSGPRSVWLREEDGYGSIPSGGPVADTSAPPGLTRTTGMVVDFQLRVPRDENDNPGDAKAALFPIEIFASAKTTSVTSPKTFEVIIDRFPLEQATGSAQVDPPHSWQRQSVRGKARNGVQYTYFGGWDARAALAPQTCVNINNQKEYQHNVSLPGKIARPVECRSKQQTDINGVVKLYGRYAADDMSFRRVGDIARVLRIGHVLSGSSDDTVSEALAKKDEAANTVKDCYVDITDKAKYRRLLSMVTVNSPAFDGLDNDGDGLIDLTGKDGEDRGYAYLRGTTMQQDNLGPELYQFAPVNLKTAPPEVIRGLLPVELKNAAARSFTVSDTDLWDLAVQICRAAQSKGTASSFKSPADILDLTAIVADRGVQQLFLGDGCDDDNNGAPDDWAEQTWLYGYMSNWATTRSDCFAVYGTVRARTSVGGLEGVRRFVAVLDRVPVTAFRPFADLDVTNASTTKAPNKYYLNSRLVSFSWL